MTQTISEDEETAYGIVFVGPPGSFSVWRETPQGDLIDRPGAEKLGQLAALAGAADYRVFPLKTAERVESAGSRRFAPASQVDACAELLARWAGVPPDSPPGRDA